MLQAGRWFGASRVAHRSTRKTTANGSVALGDSAYSCRFVKDLSLLPHLGVGISAEFDSARRGIDALELREEHPGLIDFLEYGADLARGLDDHVLRWAARGLPTTYHFLDLNLEERVDVDDEWVAQVIEHVRQIDAAWLCGDGGLWHMGPRDRGHETLMPPILCPESAAEMAESILAVEDGTGLTCLPENPPAVIYLGDLHLLDYYAEVCARTGGGLLLDCAHLAIFQRMRGHDALTGLDGFPLDRVVELHVAGGVLRNTDGFGWVDDTHAPEPLPETWRILEHVLPRTSNLKAIVYECERNQPGEVLEGFARIRSAADSVWSGS